MSEQQLIEKYFTRHQTACDSVAVSVGDDAAVLNFPKDAKLVVTTDTLNEGVHFYTDCEANYIGHKSLAVSLSDIAAMGAMPLWATLNLSLPTIDHLWIEKFSTGLYELADLHNVKIVGGDLVRGPLSITLTVIGSINSEKQLLRSNCQVDDLIYVTGSLGDAAFGLKLINNDKLTASQEERDYFLACLYKPTPRLDASQLLVKFANAAIDVSDGFLLDIQRMLTLSNKGAEINVDKMPVSKPLRKYLNNIINIEDILISAEDYQLVFTINPKDKDRLEMMFCAQNIKITEVGKIIAGTNLKLFDAGKLVNLPKCLGFDHFS